MTTDLAVPDERPATTTVELRNSPLIQWAYEARQAAQIAASLAKTSFVPASLRNKADDITAAILAGLGAMFFQVPALGLAVSAMVALLSAGLILFETSRIVNGGETNYVLATVGLYVSIFNLFTSLLSLFGFGGSDD